VAEQQARGAVAGEEAVIDMLSLMRLSRRSAEPSAVQGDVFSNGEKLLESEEPLGLEKKLPGNVLEAGGAMTDAAAKSAQEVVVETIRAVEFGVDAVLDEHGERLMQVGSWACCAAWTYVYVYSVSSTACISQPQQVFSLCVRDGCAWSSSWLIYAAAAAVYAYEHE
jgi:hypothetical protein